MSSRVAHAFWQFRNVLALMYDPGLIGPLTIFKMEHRCCECRSIQNQAKGWVRRHVQYSRPLPGPSLNDVLVRVWLPAAGPLGEGRTLLVGVSLNGCRCDAVVEALAQLRTAMCAETRSVEGVARALAGLRAAAATSADMVTTTACPF